MNPINEKMLKTAITNLTRSRNKILNIHDNVRWFDYGTTMCQLANEIYAIDEVLNKLVYIEEHPDKVQNNPETEEV